LSRLFRIEEKKSPVFIPGMALLEAKRRPLEQDASIRALEAERKALEIVKSAEAEASQILSKAKEAAEKASFEARRDGFQDGYREGYREGLESGLKDAEKYLEEAKKALGAAKESFEAILEEREPELLALSLEVAKRIVGDALREDPELILGMLRRGIEALGDEREYSIRVDPHLVAFLAGQKEELVKQYNAKSLEIMGDPSVGEGLIIETPHGTVDARVLSQIENIASAIKEARKKSRERS